MTGRRLSNAIIIGVVGFLGFLLAYTLIKQAPSYNIVTLVFLLCVTFASLRLNQVHKAKFVVFLVSIGISLLAAEVILTLWPLQSARQAPGLAALAGEEFPIDTRSVIEIIEDFRNDGVDAYPAITARLVSIGNFTLSSREFLPLAGIANKTTVLCNEVGTTVIYESDEHGFNNPQGIWGRDRLDFAAVGDSYIHGLCVDSDRTAVSLIRNVHENTLNLGLIGAGPLMELGIVKEYLVYLKPQVVLWFYFEGNDLDDLTFELSVAQLRKYSETDYRQNLMVNQSQIDRALAHHITLKSVAGTFGKLSAFDILQLDELRNRIFRVAGVCPTDTAEKRLSDFERILTDAKVQVQSWGGELFFVYLPTWERYSGYTGDCGAKRFMAAAQLHDQVVAVAASAGLPVIDIKDAFDAHPDPLALWPFRKNGHYNEDGNRLVAETVLSAAAPD